MNKNNFEHRVIGHILFNGALYEIAGQDEEHIIRLSDLEIEFEKPTSDVHYSDLYILEKYKLYLNTIRLENCWGQFPTIDGVKAISTAGAIIYKGLKRPVLYTGTIIVKRGYKEICQEKDSLMNRLFGCRQLLCFTLKDGAVIKCKNMSRLCKRIQRIGKRPEKLTRKKSHTHLQELFLRDYNKKVVQSKNELFQYYMEYFNASNKG